MVEINKATIDQVNILAEMGKAFFYEAKWDKFYEWDDESASEAILALINNPQATVLVAKKDNQIVGMGSALVYPVWYNKNINVGQEFFLYVKPEYRKGAGDKLKYVLEQEARCKNARTMVMGSVEGMPDLVNYYKRTGYAPSEHTFIKRL